MQLESVVVHLPQAWIGPLDLIDYHLLCVSFSLEVVVPPSVQVPCLKLALCSRSNDTSLSWASGWPCSCCCEIALPGARSEHFCKTAEDANGLSICAAEILSCNCWSSLVVADAHVRESTGAERENKARRLGIQYLKDCLGVVHSRDRMLDAMTLLLNEIQCSRAGDGLPVCDLAARWHDHDQSRFCGACGWRD